jgi:hypothetical protein
MTDSVAAPGADKGVLGRAIGIVVSPGATFEAVVRAPRPAGILFLVCVVLALATGLPQFTEQGRQAALDSQVQAIERFTGQPVSDDAYAQMEQRAQYGGYITIASMFVVLPIISMLFAGLYWAVFNTILGGTATFKQVLAIVTHSQVIAALGSVLAMPIQYAQGIQSMAGPFNLGALLPMLDPGSFLARFLGGISVFTLWQLVVTAIGLGVLYRRRSGKIATGLIVAYLVIAAVVTAVISSFAGGN